MNDHDARDRGDAGRTPARGRPGAAAVARFQHVRYGWNDADAPSDPVDRLVYRSNLLGFDQRITNTGGGNTSSKVDMPDPLTGETVEVLWVKGSGGDLRTSGRDNFASLYMDRLRLLRAAYEEDPEGGPKGAAEDRMVAMYAHAVFGLNARASSIDTPLHAFVPFRHVDHTHPNAVIAVAAAADGERLTYEIYGDEVAWLPWQRPGFDLGLALARLLEARPTVRGAVLGKHGLINWADDDRACYELSLELIERAARVIEERAGGSAPFGGARIEPLDEDRRRRLMTRIVPALRGRVSLDTRKIATLQTDGLVARFVDSRDAPALAALGTSCPDHFLRTKIRPMFVDWEPSRDGSDERLAEELLGRIDDALEAYRADYGAYYQACRREDSPPMRDANPSVVLVPGLGLIAFGKNKSESRVTAEFYNAAVDVMRGAETLDRYSALPQQEAFDIEYWALEEAKLRRLPPDKELAGRVVVVIGAGNGIGRAVAHRVAREGAHVVCADLRVEDAEAVAAELSARLGPGIGVAGSGLSGCGPALGLGVDVTDRESVRGMFSRVVEAYGGFDGIVVTAGVFVPPDRSGRIGDDQWDLTFAVNVKGAYLVADEAKALWQAQGLSGALVLTTSVNGAVPKAGSLAYDTSKAAANHLVRELAIELAPHVRVNGLAPATVVEGSSMFPRERVLSSLGKYGVPFEESEDTASLRERLARFYADRTLTKSPVTLEDQAEAAFLLVGDRLAKTTGQIVSVDGGLHEAFLR